ncbi:MAG: CoA transferase [Chloroflexi bacterium]|nr:CoA transferase [Chloroflexota bacterium]
MAQALDDLRVIEVAEGWAGPLCGRLLMELGAEVIKVEPPKGDWLRAWPPIKNGVSHAFQVTSCGKKSVVIDLESAEGRQQFRALIEHADILVEDRPAGYLDWLGFGYEALSRSNPGLIHCSLTPFGRVGPLANWVGTDLTVQAVSGVMATSGYRDGPAIRAGARYADHVAAFVAATAILAAVNERDRTGLGQFADISLYDSMVVLLSNFLVSQVASGLRILRDGSHHPLVAPSGVYPTSDGWVIIYANDDKHWVAMAKAMGREDLLDEPRFKDRGGRRTLADELDVFVIEWTKTKTRDEVIRVMEEILVPAGPIFDVAQLLADPHFEARGMVAKVSDPKAGKFTIPGPIFKLSETPDMVSHPAPALGAHTEEVFSSLKARPTAAAKPVAGGSGTNHGKALEGIRVLEVGMATTGPYATKILGTLGAEVIKIEPPGGEATRSVPPRMNGLSYGFNAITNIGKRSLTLNTMSDHGKAIFYELVRTADVLQENFSPGRMDQWGIGYEQLSEVNPGLIYNSTCGFGQKGPYSYKRAYDTVIQGMSGIMSITGPEGGPPMRVGVSAADMTGAISAPVAILAALHYRNRMGKGQRSDLAMQDATAWLTGEAWTIYEATGQPPGPMGNRHWLIAPHNVYQAKDGPVAIAAERGEEWQSLARAMERLDLLQDPRFATMAGRRAEVEALDAEIGAWVGKLSVAEVVEQCQRARVPTAPVLELDAAFQHPHAQAREMVIQREGKTMGTMTTLGSPYKLSRTPGQIGQIELPLGRDTESILGQLGYTAEQIGQLRAEGII